MLLYKLKSALIRTFSFFQEDIEYSLRVIHDVAIRSWGTLCVTENFRMLTVPLSTARFEGARQKADMAAMLLKDLGIAHHNGEFMVFNERLEKRMRKKNNGGL